MSPGCRREEAKRSPVKEKVHIKMHDKTCHLREFIAAHVDSTDPYSADTEAPRTIAPTLYRMLTHDKSCIGTSTLKGWGQLFGVTTPAVQGLPDMIPTLLQQWTLTWNLLELHRTPPLELFTFGLIGQFHLPGFGEYCPPPNFGWLTTDFWHQQLWRWFSSFYRLRERKQRSI